MKPLTLAPNLKLPAEAVTETFAIIAKRGMGKTYLGSVMAEEMIGNGHQVCVIDPIGVWWGLRSSADGKSAGLPVVILGGEHGDAPLEPTAGSVIADFIIDNYVPVILDLSLFRKAERTRFMSDFAERLYFRNRDPLHLMVDEADAFAPQRPMKGEERMLGAMEDIVRRGRARGLGITLITQRSAVINKDVLTQVEVLISLRVVSPQDRNAVDEWVKVHMDDPHQRDAFLTSLPSLPVGEAWFWSPGWLEIFKHVKVRPRQTFDSSATPKVGERKLQPKVLAEIDLEALAGQIADTIEKAKADDPKELRRQIAELKRQLSSHVCPSAEQVEVRVITDDDLKAIGSFQQRFDEIVKQLQESNSHDSANNRRSTSWKHGRRSSPGTPEVAPRRDGVGSQPSRSSDRRQASRPTTPETHPQTRTAGETDLSLKAGARRIVETLAMHYPMKFTKPQIGTLTKFKITGGTFSTYWSQIRNAGLIEESDGLFWASEAGLDFAGVRPEAPRTTAEHLAMWNARLKRGAREILEVLVNHYPDPWTKEDLGFELGMAHTGGTFNTYISHLRTNKLIETDGDKLHASDWLFLEN